MLNTTSRFVRNVQKWQKVKNALAGNGHSRGFANVEMNPNLKVCKKVVTHEPQNNRWAINEKVYDLFCQIQDSLPEWTCVLAWEDGTVDEFDRNMVNGDLLFSHGMYFVNKP